MPDFIPASDLKELAQKLVERYPLYLEDVDIEKIAFFRDITTTKGRKLAYVEKTRPLDKQLNPNFDFKLVVIDALTNYMNPAQFNILMLHELRHIGPTTFDNNGNEKTKLITHDVQEHSEIIEVFGLHWKTDETVRDPLEKEPVEIKKPITNQDDEEE